jgi:7,8-dihydropterin-6-yl-methyl-4-(beta-D-ribofuranosyl)aminobenzene 5'-phosphate synthase
MPTPEPRRLRAVDTLEVCVLVDNTLDILSSVPDCVTSEVQNVLAAGAKELSGSCLCCAAWGLSLVIRVQAGGVAHTLLFDAGPEAYAFERNSKRLGVRLADVGCVALSHGHFDHAGGMPRALTLITEANGGRAVPVHVNPGMFVERAFARPDGTRLPLGRVPSPEELQHAGGEVVSSGEPRLVCGDMVYLSGEIPRRTTYERGLPAQIRRGEDGEWVPDPLVLDERFLAVHVEDRGVVVFSACSHAGIVNVLMHAAETFDPLPLHGVMGGLHLAGKTQESWIDDTIRDLRPFGLARLVPGHCTGWRALSALTRAFGDAVIPGAVGQVHRFG